MADTTTDLQITITARDEATAKLTELKQALEEIKQEQATLAAVTVESAGSANAYIEAQTKLAAANRDLASTEKEIVAATSQVKAVTKEAATAQKEHDAALKAAADSATAGGMSFGQLTGALSVSAVAAQALQKAVGDLKQYLSDTIKVATDYQSALIGVETVGKELGQSTDQVTTAIKTLTKDGLLNAQQAANDLRNVMQRGFNVDQATQAIQAMKDFGSFGKKGQEDLGAAIDSATLGWRHQRSVMMENAGFLHTFQEVWQQYAAQQGKSVSQLTEQDKRQAELNAVMQQGATATGDAAKFTKTYAGEQETLANKSLDVKAAIGDALMPAVTYLRQNFLAFMGNIAQFISDHGPALQQLFFDVSKVFATFAQEVMLVGSLIGSLFSDVAAGSFQPTVDAWNSGIKSISDTASISFDSVKSSATDAANAAAVAALRSADQQSAAQKKAGQQIADEYAKETQRFNDALAQRQQTFADSLQKMLQAHQDKVATIKTQLADEQASYDDAMKQRQDTYNEQVASLEDAHATKVQDITQQISDEKAKGIYIDGVLFSQGNAKKLESLQDNLDKENAKYAVAQQKLTDKYNDEVKTAKAAYDKKEKALQDSLNKEQAILQAHATEVSQMSARVAEDDIATLERKFQEQNAKEAQHHTEALAAIGKRAVEKGVADATGYANGARAAIPLASGAFKDMGTALGKSLIDGVAQSAKATYDQSFLGKLMSNIQAMQNNPGQFGTALLAGAADWAGITFQGKKLSEILGFPHHASGTSFAPGGLSVVGENGPELVNLPRGAQVLNTNDTRQALSGGQGGGVHIENFHNYSPTDLAAFSRELAWRLN